MDAKEWAKDMARTFSKNPQRFEEIFGDDLIEGKVITNEDELKRFKMALEEAIDLQRKNSHVTVSCLEYDRHYKQHWISVRCEEGYGISVKRLRKILKHFNKECVLEIDSTSDNPAITGFFNIYTEEA